MEAPSSSGRCDSYEVAEDALAGMHSVLHISRLLGLLTWIMNTLTSGDGSILRVVGGLLGVWGQKCF